MSETSLDTPTTPTSGPLAEVLHLEIAKLALGPDDMLVIRALQHLTPEDVAHIKNVVCGVTGHDRVLVMDSRLEVSVVEQQR